jgi:putative colanic acid biosynthesis acetyltransferase WcaF
MTPPPIDIDANRKARKYSRAEMAKRILWSVCKPFFRFSPRIFFGWRALLLRNFGARLGAHVHIYNSADICMPWNLRVGDWSAVAENVSVYNLGAVEIGSQVTISRGAHLCAATHDYTVPSFPLIKMPIVVEDAAWICADAFIGPGVTVGQGSIVGARAVVMKDVPSWAIVAGNPAKIVRQDRRVARPAKPE